MKGIIIIIIMLIVSIAGCFAQERGMFICEAITFDTTSQIQGRVLVEISPTKNQVEFNFGDKRKAQTFYLENSVQIIGDDCIIKGRATSMDVIRLFYTKGLLVGGLISKQVFVPRTGRYRTINVEFTRQTLTSN